MEKQADEFQDQIDELAGKMQAMRYTRDRHEELLEFVLGQIESGFNWRKADIDFVRDIKDGLRTNIVGKEG
jgi:hypothetical protein